MDFYQQIDKYILGKMSSEEKATFQEAISKDASLAEEVKARELILTGMETLSQQEMKERILSVRQEMLKEEIKETPKGNASTARIIRFVLSAAAIFLLIFAGLKFFQKSDIDSSQLFAESFERFSPNLQSRTSLDLRELVQAENDYDSKNYTAAIPLLQKLLADQPENSELELTLANSFLDSDNLEDAQKHFSNIIKRKDSLYSETAQWYLALTYLKKNNIGECKKLLEEIIANPAAEFHDEAKKLKAKL